jgi:hypothetical protein
MYMKSFLSYKSFFDKYIFNLKMKMFNLKMMFQKIFLPSGGIPHLNMFMVHRGEHVHEKFFKL